MKWKLSSPAFLASLAGKQSELTGLVKDECSKEHLGNWIQHQEMDSAAIRCKRRATKKDGARSCNEKLLAKK